MNSKTAATPNHALQRTAPGVTAPIPRRPTAQESRRTPLLLSLGSLAHSLMSTRIIAALFAMTAFVSADEEMRTGTAKECYMYSHGKGPNWVAKVSMEFRLSLLNRQMPYVDERFFEPTDKAFTWIDCQKERTVTTIATVEGRKVIRVEYPEKGSFGKTIGTVLLAIESARDTEWFSPFFAAQPELFSGQFISGRDVAFGYIATLGCSGLEHFALTTCLTCVNHTRALSAP